MTNYEKIQSMSVEEMAKEFEKNSCDHCIRCYKYTNEYCSMENINIKHCCEGIKQWLEQEADNESI